MHRLKCLLGFHDYPEEYDDVAFVAGYRIHKYECRRCGSERTIRVVAPGLLGR